MSNVMRKMRRHSDIYKHLHRRPKYIKLNYKQKMQLQMMQSVLGMALLKTLSKVGKTANDIRRAIIGGR